MGGKRELITRNQQMDLYRGVAIYGVICIHVLFPGLFGEGVRALARFAVPFFFLTAGYFNFGASPRALLRRAARTLRQLLLAGLLYLLLGCMITARKGEAVIPWVKNFWNVQYLEEFLQFHTVPFPYAWQLWFLGAMVTVYLLWCAITVLSGGKGRVPYGFLAGLGVVLLAIHLGLGEGAVLMGREMDNRILRNAFLDGLPFFALGGWAASRKKTIGKLGVPWKLLILIGCVLSLAESRIFGRQELYLGTVVLLAGLMGQCIRSPRASQQGVAAFLQFCGDELTLTIFTVHMVVIALIRELPALDGLEAMVWILPVVVALISTLVAIGQGKMQYWFRNRKKGRRGI